MNSHRWFRSLFLLVTIVLFTACMSHHDESTRAPGNVQLVVSAAPATTLAASTSVASSAGVLGEDDDGEDEDGDGGILTHLSQLNVTFSSLMARNLDGNLVSLTIELPQTIDLIQVINGRQVTLPAGTLPVGMYDQIIVVIRTVEFVFLDGTSKVLTPPGGGWTKIIPVEPFEVVDGQTITIELRFNPLRACGENEGEFEFSPDFEGHRGD